MSKLIKVKNSAIGIFSFKSGEVPPHLNEDEVNRLTKAYQEWYDRKPNQRKARQWAIFLLMRFTGCRVSEAILVDDTRDIDFRRSEVVLRTLKRQGKDKNKAKRVVPIPANVTAEFARIIAEFPGLRGSLFRLHRATVFMCFRKRAIEAGLPEELRHPHILRHTRAIELLRSGVPVTMVQQLLGHSSIMTTAVYLRFTGYEIKQVLKDRGLI
jgi:molybdate transport system regulatory protein